MRIRTLYAMNGKNYPRLCGTSGTAEGSPRGSISQGWGTNQKVYSENFPGIAELERQ